MGIRLAFAFPLLFQIFWDTVILRRPYYVGTGDVVQSYVGLGFSLLDGFALFDFPAPGGLFQALSFFLLRSGWVSQESFGSVAAVMTGLHVVLILGCARWVGRSLERLGLTSWEAFCIGAVFAAFPGFFVLSTTFSIYYALSLLALSSLIVLGERMCAKESGSADLWVPFFILGIVGSNSYLLFLNLVVPVLGISTVLLLRRKFFFSTTAFSTFRKTFPFREALGISAVPAFVFLLVSSKLPLRQREIFLILFGMVGVLSLLLYKRRRGPLLLRQVWGPFLWGMLLGMGSTMKVWFKVLGNIDGIYAGQAADRPSMLHVRFEAFKGFWARNDLTKFFADYPYFALSLAVLFIAVLALFKSKPQFLKGGRWLLAGAAVSSICLGWFSTAPLVVMDWGQSPAMRWSLNARYLSGFAVAVTLGMLLFIVTFRRRWAWVILSLIAPIFFGLGLYRYQTAMAGMLAQAGSLEVQLQNFLKDSHHAVVCARVTYPEICSASYARTTYRDSQSLASQPRTSFMQGRVIEIGDMAGYSCDFSKKDPFSCFKGKLSHLPADARIWLIMEDRDQLSRPKGADLIWTNPELKVSVFEPRAAKIK